MARFNVAAKSPASLEAGLQPRWYTDNSVSAVGAEVVSIIALLLSDLLAFAIVLACAVVLLVGFRVFPPQGSMQSGAVLRDTGAVLGIGVLGVIVYFAASGHYTRRLAFSSEIKQIGCSSLFAFGLSVSSAALVAELHAYLGLAAAWLLFPIAVLCGRRLARSLLKWAGVSRVRMILVGDGRAVTRVLPSLTAEAGFNGEVAAVMNRDERQNLLMLPRSWRSILRQYRANLIIVCDDIAGTVAMDVAPSLANEGVPFAVAAYSDGLQPSAFHRTELLGRDVTLLRYRHQMARPADRISKIAIDVFIAAVCLVAMLPLLLIITVMVKSDGGPLFFGHTRVGLGGKSFKCLKFRSMVVDSEAVLMRLLETDADARAEWAETQKLRHDPRVTAFGRFLRSFSLDELPQLLNVLRLEMSLVGPRPIVPAELPRYGEDIAYYYQTRPGLTGLWQISGRSSTGYSQRVEFDRCYVRNWTIWQDFVILAKTVPAVLKRRGAY